MWSDKANPQGDQSPGTDSVKLFFFFVYKFLIAIFAKNLHKIKSKKRCECFFFFRCRKDQWSVCVPQLSDTKQSTASVAEQEKQRNTFCDCVSLHQDLGRYTAVIEILAVIEL